MQSFLAKHSDCQEQVIQDGKFVIIVREFGSVAEANNEYKNVKNEVRKIAEKIKHLELVKEKTIIKQVRHKPLREFIRKKKIMGLPFWYNKNKP